MVPAPGMVAVPRSPKYSRSRPAMALGWTPRRSRDHARQSWRIKSKAVTMSMDATIATPPHRSVWSRVWQSRSTTWAHCIPRSNPQVTAEAGGKARSTRCTKDLRNHFCPEQVFAIQRRAPNRCGSVASVFGIPKNSSSCHWLPPGSEPYNRPLNAARTTRTSSRETADQASAGRPSGPTPVPRLSPPLAFKRSHKSSWQSWPPSRSCVSANAMRSATL